MMAPLLVFGALQRGARWINRRAESIARAAIVAYFVGVLASVLWCAVAVLVRVVL